MQLTCEYGIQFNPHLQQLSFINGEGGFVPVNYFTEWQHIPAEAGTDNRGSHLEHSN